MFAKRFLIGAVTCMALLGLGATIITAQADKKSEKKVQKKEVWTDASDPTLPADFKFQGEYVNSAGGGYHVIALGNGEFQAVIYHPGLPGKGLVTNARILLHGKREGDKVILASIDPKEKRRYLAQSPLEFSATAKFPPEGQVAGYTGVIEGDTLKVKVDVSSGEGKKLIRKSPTLGAKPPEGAIVLFDGSSKDEWNGGRLDKKTGFLNTDGGEVTTKRKFSNYTAHVEFMLPFRPDARGQGRGNSGFYQVDHYEVQILDSFGLEGMNNECGGVYSLVKPSVNMCLPPLQWQTYDVEFTNAVRDDTGKKIKNSRLTVKLNGVVIHNDVELKGVTGGARMEPEGTPGLLRLQGHGNPLQFKNIWVVEKK